MYIKSKLKCKFCAHFRPQHGECSYALQLAACCSSTAKAAGPISSQTYVLVPRAQCFIISSERSASGILLRARTRPVRNTAGGLRSVYCAEYAYPRHYWQDLLHRERVSSLVPLNRARVLSFCWTNLCVTCYHVYFRLNLIKYVV